LNSTTLVVKGKVVNPQGGNAATGGIRLQAEVKPLGTPFDGTGIQESSTVASGGQAEVTIAGPSGVHQHLRARVKMMTSGGISYSPWRSYGLRYVSGIPTNSESLPDFYLTPPSPSITESSGSTNVIEGGATDTYDVVLGAEPLFNVTITAIPDSQVTVSPFTLTFTPANWNTPQTILVTAVDDTILEGGHTGTITHTSTSFDLAFNNLSIPSVTTSITDNEKPTYVPPSPSPSYYEEAPELPPSVGGVPLEEIPTPKPTFQPGDLLKCLTASIYYFGPDNKKYLLPTVGTYFTWYPDFSPVKTISQALLDTISFGNNVTYRPGNKLVKFPYSPKVYAIEKNGLLRHITSEAIAESLYGPDWYRPENLDTIPESFEANYTSGTPITSSSQYDKAQAMASSPDIATDKGLTSLYQVYYFGPQKPPSPSLKDYLARFTGLNALKTVSRTVYGAALRVKQYLEPFLLASQRFFHLATGYVGVLGGGF
jgi:hypothetical protein